MAQKPNGEAGALRDMLREVIREELGHVQRELDYLRAMADELRAGQHSLRALIDLRIDQLKVELIAETESIVKTEVGGVRTLIEQRIETALSRVLEGRVSALEEGG